MWTHLKADMVFKGDSFKLVENPHLTFKLLDEPVIDNTKVLLKSRISGNGKTKHISLPYGSDVLVWDDRNKAR